MTDQVLCWAHIVLDVVRANLQATLTQMGDDGWELVSVESGDHYLDRLYFKRRKYRAAREGESVLMESQAPGLGSGWR